MIEKENEKNKDKDDVQNRELEDDDNQFYKNNSKNFYRPIITVIPNTNIIKLFFLSKFNNSTNNYEQLNPTIDTNNEKVNINNEPQPVLTNDKEENKLIIEDQEINKNNSENSKKEDNDIHNEDKPSESTNRIFTQIKIFNFYNQKNDQTTNLRTTFSINSRLTQYRNKVFITGGHDLYNNDVRDCYIYNYETNTSSTLQMGYARSFHSSFHIGKLNVLVVISGIFKRSCEYLCLNGLMV